MAEGNEKGCVCVTGGTGFLASRLIMKLLQQGYAVNATVRSHPGGSPKDASFLTSLEGAPERLRIFVADLDNPETFSPAIEGCVGVFHVAQPMPDLEDPEDDDEAKYGEAVRGAVRIFELCVEAGTVKRVVYTSSESAMVFNGEGAEVVDESCWSDVEYIRSSISREKAYSICKTMIEKAGFEFAHKSGLDLVTVIPPYIHGPFITPQCPYSVRLSMAWIFGDNDPIIEYQSVIPFVHVDDLASAHIFVFEHPNAEGSFAPPPCPILTCHVATLGNDDRGSDLESSGLKRSRRFPGLDGIDVLVKSWKVKCRSNPQSNGFVLFRFQSEEDRCSVISSGSYFLYGKRLFFDSLPENFKLESSDFCMVPTWVRFTDLPAKCWKPATFSKIASCLGNLISMDKVTKIGNKKDYARILVEIDSSIPPHVSVIDLLPNGETFHHAVSYEVYPRFFMHCKSVKHYKEQCPKLEPLPGFGDRRAPRQIENCKRGETEGNVVDCPNSFEIQGGVGLGEIEGTKADCPSSLGYPSLEPDGMKEVVNVSLVGEDPVTSNGNEPTPLDRKPVVDDDALMESIPRGISSTTIPMDTSLFHDAIIPQSVGNVDNLHFTKPARPDSGSNIGMEIVPFNSSVVVSGDCWATAGGCSRWEAVDDSLPIYSSSFPSLGLLLLIKR
nr:Vestitone reductase [Ipomoea batatas]